MLFVHGIFTTFDEAAQALGGIWHFLERKPVPILYSWPAGAGGIRAFFIDGVAAEFTIFHLKETLRTLFEMPEIEKIHIVAHSRGADVTASALRELFIEQTAKNSMSKETFKIENLILAAPDLDFGVVEQRFLAEAFSSAIGKVTVYTTGADKALSFAQLLTRGIQFGRIMFGNTNQRDRSILERAGNVHFVEAEDIKSFTGHDYFVTDSAVSADMLTTIKHSAEPGSELRPLIHGRGAFWILKEGYPQTVAAIKPRPYQRGNQRGNEESHR